MHQRNTEVMLQELSALRDLIKALIRFRCSGVSATENLISGYCFPSSLFYGRYIMCYPQVIILIIIHEVRIINMDVIEQIREDTINMLSNVGSMYLCE